LTLLTAEFYEFVREWLDKFFGGLKRKQDWYKFYGFLVLKVDKRLIKSKSTIDIYGGKVDRIPQVNVENIMVPKDEDICNVCRLFFQAICKFRNAIPDGQHRMTALVHLLSGYGIKIDSQIIPDAFFVHDETHAGLFSEGGPSDPLSLLLRKTNMTCTARIIVPNLFKTFEQVCQSYSLQRTDSHGKTRQRLIQDV
jgi:hypothetical protein